VIELILVGLGVSALAVVGAVRQRRSWRAVAAEPIGAPPAFPPETAQRAILKGVSTYTWSDQLTQDVARQQGDKQWTEAVPIGLEIHVAVACPDAVVDPDMVALTARWSSRISHHRGHVWQSGPDASLDGDVSELLRLRLVAITIARSRRAGEAIPALVHLSILGGREGDLILSALVAEFGTHPDVLERAGERTTEGPGPVRLQCARLVQDADAYVAIAVDGAETEQHRITAFEWVVEHHRAGIDQAVRSGLESDHSALIRVAAPHAGPGSADRLEELTAELDDSGGALKAAAGALLRMDRERGTKALLGRLEDASDPVQFIVIRALGSGGDLSAVAQLQKIADALLASSELETAAADAVSRIQQRFQGPAGALSLADDTDGAGDLSLVDQGQVSIADTRD
jgi:hypothetical protein